MSALPTGTVTFLFTDIVGSTETLAALGGEAYGDVLGIHHQRLRDSWQRHGGVEVSTEGDAFFVVFTAAVPAVQAAIEAQRALHAEPWARGAEVRVRMGLHTGEARLSGVGYVGLDVHRAARVASAAHGGQVLISGSTRALAEQSLPDGVTLRDLGRHRLKGLPSPEHIHQLVIEGLPAEFPAIASLDARPNNLPVTMTSFVGRSQQLAELTELLARSRLVTLTGPGGTGKTRLAMRVAEEMLAERVHECWFVALEALRDPELVAATIASTLAVTVGPDRSPLDAVSDWLADRHALLVLDNFEQVTGAASVVTTLLAAAPELRVLVTSRVPLHLYGEQEYPVPPLARAGATGTAAPDIDALGRNEAVQLFVERAMTVTPDFRLDESNAAAVAGICERLDGLPLAIELAAARVKLLGPREILARLEQSLLLLSSTARDLPQRQRTLRCAIDWSYDLLGEAEQGLFARLAAFRGGFTVQAVEAVAADPSGEADVLDGLAVLVDNSLLVRREQDATSRFAMLETIREHARDKLSQQSDATDTLARHAAYAFELAHEAGGRLLGDAHAHWLDRLAEEQDNLRAAFDRAPSLGMLGEALAAAGAMWRFWHLRGQFGEGRTILERLLTEGDADPAARAAALTGAGGLAYWQGDFEPMGRHYEQARSLYESLGDRQQLALALYNESYVHIVARNFDPAIPLLERAAALHRELGNKAGLADTELAVGYIQYLVGDPAVGQARVEDAVRIYRDIGAAWQLADALTALGYMRAVAGDWPPAIAAEREALEIFEQMGGEMGISMALDAIASVGSWHGDHALAGRLFGKADEIRQRLGGTPPLRVHLAETHRQQTLEAVGEDEWRRLFAEGAALDTAAAVQLARSFASPGDDAQALPRPTSRSAG